jgi:PAS domain-containing protein
MKSKRKSAEEALQESEARFRRLIVENVDGIVVMDPEWMIRLDRKSVV